MNPGRPARDYRADRALLLAALTEAREPLRFDQVLSTAIGRQDWTPTEERDTRTDLAALEHNGTIVRYQRGWETVYRLATDQDLTEREDLAEVARLSARWETA